MAAQTLKFQKGDTVTYQDVDMEHYSRGYGLMYETKKAQVVEVYYKLSNGECVPESKLTLVPTKGTSQVLESTKETSQVLESTKGTSVLETQKSPSNGQ